MADIHLLFDVFGGESIHEGSGKEINRQLTEIVRQINANPFKINFEADEEALNRIKKAFSDLHKAIGENGTIKFDTPNLSDISKTLSAISENFKHVLVGIGNQNLQLKHIFEAIPEGGESSVKSLQNVVSMITELTDTISYLSTAVDEIRQKSGQGGLTPPNIINEDAIRQNETQLNTWREYLQMLLRETQNAQAVYRSIMSNNTGIGARQAYDTTAKLDKNARDILTNFDYDAMSSGVTSMNLEQVQSFAQTYTSLLTTLSNIRSRGEKVFGEINTAAINEAKQKTEEFSTAMNAVDNPPDTSQSGLFDHITKIKEAIEALRDPCKLVKDEVDKMFMFDGVEVTGQAELVEKVKSMCDQLGEEFDNLRVKIESTFNFSGVEIIPPDVTKTISEIANTTKDMPVGGVTGMTRSEIESIIKSKLGSEGGALAESSLKSFGATAEDAKRIVDDLLKMGGNIKDVTTHFKDLADGTRDSFDITATAVDDLGNTIKEKLVYRMQELENEAGETVKALQLVQREQIEKISYGADASNPYGLSADDLALWDSWNKEHERRIAEIDQENIAIEKQKQQLRSLEEERDRLAKQSFDTWDAGEEAKEIAEVDAAWSEHIKTTEAYAEQIDKENIAVERHRKELQALEDEYDRIGKQSFDAWDAGEDAKEEAELERAIRSVNTAREDQADLEREMARIHDETASRARQRAEAEEENRRRQEAANEREQESARQLEETYKDLSAKITSALSGKDRALGKLPDGSEDQIRQYSVQLDDLHKKWEDGQLTLAQYRSGLDEVSKAYKREADAAKNTNAQERARTSEENKRLALQRKLSDESGRAAKVLRDYTSAERSQNAASRDAYKNIQKLIPQMDELNDRIQRNDIGTEEAAREQRKYSAALAENTATIEKNGNAHLTAFGKIAKAVKTHLTTLSATMIIGTIMREARQMITTVTEIDTAMTELRKVTDETEERYTRFLDNAADRAKNLSATISDTVTATADFARLGLTIDEAEKAADAAIVYKAVGDGIENISDASQSIVSTMKAFGIEASGAMTIVDKFNEVGNNFAISSAGVGEALLRSAAAMKAANNTLDETIGLATAANTILQNPQSVGTMLKTVSMYVRAAKTELEAAGEETEGIAESTGKLRELVKQITKEGGKAVDIMADENTFKSTYQIMKEISEVWNNISDANQAALLEKLGGKRNANAIAAMLENFEIAEQAMQAAADSTGSAMNELEKFQKSIEGHIVAFKTAYQELAQTLIDGDLVKKVIDFGTTMINILTKIVELIDKIGGFGSVAVILGGIGALKSFGSLPSIIDTTTRAFTGLLNVLKVIAPAFTTAMELGRGFTGSLITMVTSAINPVTIGIVGLTSVLVVAIKWYKDYKKEQEEIRSKTIEASKAAKDQDKKISDLIKKYDKLTQEEKDNDKKSEDLLQTRKELIEALGLEEKAVNRVAGEYVDLTDAMIRNKAISDLVKDRRAIQGEYNLAEQDLISSAQSGWMSGEHVNRIEFSGSNTNGQLTSRELAAIEQLRRSGLINGSSSDGRVLYGSDDLTSVNGIIAAQERLGKVLDVLNQRGLENADIYSQVYGVYDRLTNQINNYKTVADALNQNLLNTEYIRNVLGSDQLPQTQAEFDKLRDSLIKTIAASGDFVGSVYEIGDAVDEVLREDDRFREFLSAPVEVAEESADAIDTVSTIIAEFAQKIAILRAAVGEFEREGLISTATLNKLNEVFGENNKLVEIQNGKLSLNTDEVEKQATALRDEYGMRIAVAGATAQQIKRLDEQASTFRSVADAVEDPLSSLEDLSDLLEKMNGGYELSRDAATKLYKTYPELRDKIYETEKGYRVEIAAIQDLIKAKSDLIDWNNKEARTDAARSASITKMGSGTSADRADQVFAKFREETGRNIQTIEEYKQAWLDMFGFVAKGSVDYAKEMIAILNDESNTITQSFESAFYNNDKPGYDPTKEEKASKTSTKKEETQFEKDYKAHQHYLALDRETTEQYLNWLDGAYKASYARGEMELDDYYKYEEEIYEGRKQLFQTHLDEMQHQIDLLEHQTGDTYDKQAGIYMQMQREVHAQAEALRARGIKENDEMIRELQDQWWSYEESIRQLREQSFNDWLNDQKFTIDLQKKNNESTDAILQSWKTVLGSLNDELNYYLSVGYDKTSDVVQNIMGEIDSAKEEMISALEEVVSKANDVVDGFQNVYTTLTNAASEYASTGYLSVDSLQSILELGPKYLAMLEDENGQLVINEDRLQQVIAARTNEMAAETALSYAKQVLLATESGEIDKLRELADVQSASSSATWDMAYATLGYAKALGAAKGIEESFYDNAISYVTKMQSVTQTATASISAYYETLNAGYVSQAEGLETILKLTEDMIKQENDDKIDALEKEKDIYKDIIDEKKELLRLAKEQADHDRDQADKLKEIADLQSRIDQLALDDSREATAQRAQLEAELLEKQKALADEHGDYAYDAQVDALDKQYEAFEKEKEDETKALKEELNSAEKLYQAAIARINNGWDTLYQDLLDWNYNYGSTLEKDLTAAWNAAYAAAERYGSFVEAMEGVKEHTQLGEASYTPQSANVQSAVSRGSATITNYTNQMRANSLAWFTAENPSVYAQENQRLAKEYQQQTGTSLTYNNGSWYQSGATTPLYQLSRDEVGHAVVEAMKANSAAWNNSDYNTQMKLAQTNEDLAKRLSSFLGVQITKTPGGVWMLGATPLYDVRKFHSGGIAGGNGTIKQNEIMAILKKGESVLDSKREEALYKTVDFVQILSDKIGRVIDRGGLSSLLGGGAMSLFAPMGRAVASGVGTMNFAPTVNVTISGGNLNEENARRYGNVAADAVLDQLKTAFTKRGISTAGNGILK